MPYQDIAELLDTPGEASEAELRETLRDIRLANIFGFGTAVILKHLDQLAADWPPDKTLEVLDLATGSGDIPRAVVRWARRRNIAVHVMATDISAEVIAEARHQTADFSEINVMVADAQDVPFAPQSFDVVICSLAFHHMSFDGATKALGNMARLARVGFIVNDVERSWPAFWAATFLVTSITRNRLTRHDGPTSVKRAWTRSEWRNMADIAGVQGGRIVQHAFWRIAFVGKRR